MRFCLLCAVVLLCRMGFTQSAPPPSSSTQNPPQTAPNPSDFTLNINARVVLTDVTVTDSKGNPIHGLKSTDFRIFDNKRPQKLDSFQEHTGHSPVAVASVSTDPNVYGNWNTLHPPPVINVILLDTTTIAIADQMYLYDQLKRFVQALAPGEPLAIYTRWGDFTLVLQNFTTDHALLLAAIRRAIPRLRMPGAEYTSDFDTLQQVAYYLGQLPGRKNVIWFSGGSNLFLLPDPTAIPPNLDLRAIYDQLEADRINIYPIDARGLTGNFDTNMEAQQMLMRDVADATGGHAYYNNNGLAAATSHIISTDGSFYTLTYTPDDVHMDNTWHKVKVKIKDTSYTLSYRRGYYDDGANVRPSSNKPKTLLRPGGQTVEAPEMHSEPIPFQVRVVPASTDPSLGAAGFPTNPAPRPRKRGEATYAIQYTLPTNAFVQQRVQGKPIIVVDTAILAFNHYGTSIGREVSQVTITLDEDRLRANPDGVLVFTQQVNLPTGQDYLNVVIWDTVAGRLGSVQLNLDVHKQGTASNYEK